MSERRLSLLCISTRVCGQAFLEEAAKQGMDVFLLTLESLKDAQWPHESLSEILTMPDGVSQQDALQVVIRFARHVVIDRVVALDIADAELAAMVREEMRLPGMGLSTTRVLSDRVAARVRAKMHGAHVPSFVRVLHYSYIQRWLETTPGPWLLTPRYFHAVEANRVLEREREVWLALEELGDRGHEFFLEKYIPGSVFSVDSILWERTVLFAAVHAATSGISHAGRTEPLVTWQTVYREDGAYRALHLTDQSIVQALGMVSGVTRSEYVLSDEDNEIYFLESSARIGGALTAEMIEVESGIHSWVEWARMEVAQAYGVEYDLPVGVRKSYAGCLYAVTAEKEPDLSRYSGPEIVRKLSSNHHAGIIVSAQNAEEVNQLLMKYKQRIEADFPGQ